MAEVLQFARDVVADCVKAYVDAVSAGSARKRSERETSDDRMHGVSQSGNGAGSFDLM